MENKIHEPTFAEQAMFHEINGYMTELVSGKFSAIGICATGKDARQHFCYMESTDVENKLLLRGPINRLLGLYESDQQFGKLSNAPVTNRSFAMH